MYTGGSERLRIDTSGNVGIGTSSPAALLSFGSIASGSSDGARIYLRNNTNEFAIGTNGAQTVYAGYLGHVWQTGSFGGTERMRITSAGGISFGSSGTAYGTSGQVLQSNGNAAPTWVAVPAATSVTLPSTNPFVQNATTLSANLTITGNNAMAAGPITINTSVTLTIATGARVVIV
jgi:hypothetical protein